MYSVNRLTSAESPKRHDTSQGVAGAISMEMVRRRRVIQQLIQESHH